MRDVATRKLGLCRQPEAELQIDEVLVEPLLKADEEHVIGARAQRVGVAEPKRVVGVEVPDRVHRSLRFAAKAARTGEGDRKLVRRLEAGKCPPLLRPPRIVVARASLPQPAVEGADEPADGVANEEHEALAVRNVSERQLVPGQDRAVTRGLCVLHEDVVERSTAGLADVQYVQRLAGVVHLTDPEAHGARVPGSGRASLRGARAGASAHA